MLIKEIFGINSNKINDKAPSGIYPIVCKMGVEVELEGTVPPQNNIKYWNVIADGSLRNNGREYVLRKPLFGNTLEQAIIGLGEYLQQSPYTTSHRCSVHCHIDFTENTKEDVEKFFLLFVLAEPALYTVSSKDRYSNIYCPGLTHATEQMVDASIGFKSGKRFPEFIHRWNKYTGINLNSLSRLGTVEIRTHKGTGNAEDILLWTRILCNMKAAALSMSLEDIYSIDTPLSLAALFEEDLQEHILTSNLFEYWNSVKTNLTYYNALPQIIPAMTIDMPSTAMDRELDMEALQAFEQRIFNGEE